MFSSDTSTKLEAVYPGLTVTYLPDRSQNTFPRRHPEALSLQLLSGHYGGPLLPPRKFRPAKRERLIADRHADHKANCVVKAATEEINDYFLSVDGFAC